MLGITPVIMTNAAGKYLMQMRDNHPGIHFPLKWSFFGGGMEEGETPLETARREIFEEIGVQVELEDLQVEGTMEFASHPGRVLHIVRCRKPIEWEMIKLAEGAGAGYFSAEEIQLIGASEWAKEFAKRFL